MAIRRTPNVVAARAFAPIAGAPVPPPPVSSEKLIHFGQFIRHHRLRAGKTTEAFGREIGLTGRRVIGIEAMATPDVQHTTLVALARALGMEMEELDAAWRSTPVAVTPRRAGPTTDSAQRFAAACRGAGISTAEGMRRLRRWLIWQDESTQQRVLRFEPPAAPPQTLYTDLVDHLQNPADVSRQRLADRAAARPAAAESRKRSSSSHKAGKSKKS